MSEQRFLVNTSKACSALLDIENKRDAYTDESVILKEVQDALALINVAVIDTSADVAQNEDQSTESAKDVV